MTVAACVGVTELARSEMIQSLDPKSGDYYSVPCDLGTEQLSVTKTILVGAGVNQFEVAKKLSSITPRCTCVSCFGLWRRLLFMSAYIKCGNHADLRQIFLTSLSTPSVILHEMRFSSIAIFAFAGSALSSALAQGLGKDSGASTSPDSDGCFESCFRKSGCPPGDEACFCTRQDVVDRTACCVSKECSPEAQKIVGILAHFTCQRGTVKVPQKQADGCKTSKDSRMLMG
ncbi:hypothetical protein IWX50DRAFT_632915 [Phyllosticta citricarpa]